ncbi:polysaccharide biosynthesis protein [Riemerella anatipestifer]|uniref:Nucleoside-diphosphate sugar epimerase/dehydratase n=1 Tax=Riemerella anatipestifer TaxID=34085 RepID=A0AAP6HFM5_RIEAN|nr:nucleoside-diphosphate sugar epimerase/dehydratase [Riemerella anatipestifer]MBT0564427.1 polysaccharide biosynthesis protein [Riemerella anatipestifer]MCT6744209.1 polysaccharide biosynthesis protein [Riemerella anatipestifer]MCU7545618.1 polysaccharide biosynthesis protein [Riemerella anatipestifer]MCU7571759.1 polysaccharide biosynthesis protein [Riemerella anatipestifer]MCU7573691.1 polysaccharide biosynthesis protein [Riemerella anatipestifer]
MNFSELKNKIYVGDNMISLSNIRYLPRWMVLLIDVLFLIVSLMLSYGVVGKLSSVSYPYVLSIYQKYAVVVGVNIFFMFLFRTYSGIIRHSTFVDLSKILLASFCTVFTLGTVTYIYFFFFKQKLLLFPILLIYFCISFTVLFVFRLVVKEIFQWAKKIQEKLLKKKILLLGIGEESVAIAKAVMGNPFLPYEVVGFITDRKDSRKAKLLGKRIYTRDFLEKNTKEYLGVDGILIGSNIASREELTEWVNLFLEKDLKVFKSPTVQKLRNDGGNIKNLQIEDLLNRKPIVIENEEVKKRHYQKTVLVTGGAGSIGSEIVRQVAQFEPSLIVVLDQAETPLHEIQLEVEENYPNIRFEFVLADITNKERLESVFKEYNFFMVYHAAAYKHVPLIENNPHEAALVNIQGSKNLALLSSRFKVNRFVMVSTDKAVNPTNVMGASKRAAELFVQALQNEQDNQTKFITTRFGNVLGSNGSVIPHFRKQIEKGGPVTITHPEITRYFMTIPEACELVLQAGTMGKGGEIFVFDMGEPVKILNLARRMIKLSGLEPDVDIKIIYTGLRPGEKLYEELLSNDTKTLPTHHEKIMISKDPVMLYEEIDELTSRIYEKAKAKDKVEVVRILKEIVKEFRSNNSVFESLDK